MRVFVTGGTGFIGSAVVRELIERGHQVIGLARTDKAAELLKFAGAEVHHGDLNDLESLRRGAMVADGVIHMAFNNDFVNYAQAIETDIKVIEAMGSVLEGTGKPFVITSGTLMVAELGRIATEEDEGLEKSPRGISENIAIAMAKRGVRSVVVRLAPCVHDVNRLGLATLLAELAGEKGISAFIGDGANRWPAVHRLDAAHLFVRALESAPAGSRLHGASEEGIPFSEIAKAIGHNLKIPVVSISAEEANNHFGWFTQVVSTDNPTSSILTKELLGWGSTQQGLISDIDEHFAIK